MSIDAFPNSRGHVHRYDACANAKKQNRRCWFSITKILRR